MATSVVVEGGGGRESEKKSDDKLGLRSSKNGGTCQEDSSQ